MPGWHDPARWLRGAPSRGRSALYLGIVCGAAALAGFQVKAVAQTGGSLRLVPTDFESEMRSELRRLLPGLSSEGIESRTAEYVRARASKAQAIFYKSSGTWRVAGRATDELAGEAALESCQVHFGAPCALMAIGGRLTYDVARGARPADRDMPRVGYSGLFDPAMIPGTSRNTENREDVKAYRAAETPKAAAFHPWGVLTVVLSAPDLRSAEAQALTICNADPVRNGQEGPCFLYASGNQVVLPRRLRGMLSDAARP
jgi:hypothetical protein